MRLRTLLPAVLLVFASPGPESYGQKIGAADRLKAAQMAESRLTLKGVLNTVTFAGDRPVSSKVAVYRRPGVSRWEYKSPDLQGMVMIQKPGRVIRLDPARKTAYISEATQEPGRIHLLLKNYRAAVRAREKILGRLADIVTVISPREAHPSKKMWIDRATGLILRSEYYDSAGKLGSLSFYTDIRWNPRLENRLFEPPAGWRQVVIQEDGERHWDRQSLSSQVGFPIREPAYLPSGYLLDGFHLYRCRCGDNSALLRYVDGLNSFSLFQRFIECPRGQGRRGFGWGRRRREMESLDITSNGQSRMLSKRIPPLMYILVGDLPESELRKIAESIR
ncbi:MAG: hypothetical protein IT210_05545 [Armatimonadetes bacterium]|nr:hypothetical protein [Armatimonadota bacterium]